MADVKEGSKLLVWVGDFTHFSDLTEKPCHDAWAEKPGMTGSSLSRKKHMDSVTWHS